MVCGIYLITNNLNGHKYVGKSMDIHKRFNEHRRGADAHTSAVDRAILKYGKDSFDYQIITELPNDKKVLDAHEKYWISFYNTFKNKNHYNLTNGGEGSLMAPESRARISKANSGKKRTQEFKDYLSKLNKGKGNAFFGKKHSEESKRKMSESSKGIKLSDGHKLKISKSTNTSGYFRVHKRNDKKLKQGFNWVYRYHDADGKRISISSNDIKQLEVKVKDRGLEWKEL